MLKSIIYISILVLSIGTHVSATLALQIGSPTTLLPGSPSMDLTQVDPSTAGSFIANIIAWLLGITAVLTVLAVTYAGIQMILATGEEEKFKKARHTMIYAFVGLVVAGLAYATVTFVTHLNLDTFL
jgi:Type IV secretion system pilin